MLRSRWCTFVLMTLVMAYPTVASAGVTVVYDFAKRYGDAKVVNALSPGTRRATCGGVSKPAISLHPTTGETTATYRVPLPRIDRSQRLVLLFSVGLGDGLKKNDPLHPFDGVRFALRVNGSERFRTTLNDSGWQEGAVDLSDLAGQRVDIVFVTQPNGNSNYDWAWWGEPRILKLSDSILGKDGVAATGKGIVTAEASAGARLEVMPADPSTNERVRTSMSTRGLLVASFDFTKNKTSAVRVSGSNVRNMAVYEYDPALEIVSFGPANALVYAGQKTEFRCTIRNSGEGVLKESAGVKASLGIGPMSDPGIGISELKKQTSDSVGGVTVGSLQPGETKTVSWTTQIPDTPGVFAYVILSDGVHKDMRKDWIGSPGKPPADLPAEADAPEFRVLADGNAMLQSKGLRVVFVKGGAGFTGWTLNILKGNKWEQAGAGTFGQLIVAGKDASEPVTYRLYPARVDQVPGRAGATFTLSKRVSDANCKLEWSFVLDQSQPRVTVTNSISSDKALDILHFSGPMLYAGDGSFGQSKDEGMFPGLEYLLTESSSGTENVNPPNNLRTVPHPNKITIPFMAVRNGQTLISLEWDPLQKWDEKNDRPAAIFASPNFLDTQDNHLMGLFVPSVPEWTPENKSLAERPYTLQPGKTLRLQADVTVKSDSNTILDAVDGWLARHALPSPPPRKPAAEVWGLCNRAFLETAWDPAAKGWKHTNTGPVTFDNEIATFLLHIANSMEPGEQRDKILSVVKPAIEKAGDSINLALALHVGGVEEAIRRMSEHADALIAQQRADGSWGFTPDKKHEILGKPGDSSSGWTATQALVILRDAVVTGRSKSREAGLKALEWLDKQTRPEGAQTWELQLHVPDILASGRLVEAYVCGFQLTGDRKYLDKAVYWAKSGLPFVYLWDAPDQPIMRYGTIPVFGATWFDGQPWFGVCVQWCGLDYAYSLTKLAEYDKTLPWMKIAEGILNCGIQQQEYTTKEYPEDAGMFPDAYSPIKGKEEYHWDLNPRLIAKLFLRVVGSDGFPNTYVVTDRKGGKIFVTLPAMASAIQYAPEQLTLEFGGPLDATQYAVFAGIYEPDGVTVNGWGVPRQPSLVSPPDGFRYYPDGELTIVKFAGKASNKMVVEMISHNMKISSAPATSNNQQTQSEK